MKIILSKLKQPLVKLFNLCNIWHPKGYSTKLILSDENIFVQGPTRDDQEDCTPSYLEGSLLVMVSKPSVPIKRICVKLFGYAVDMVYDKSHRRNALSEGEQRIIINDEYQFETELSTLLQGIHRIPFKFTIDSNTPESIDSYLGSRSYQLEVNIQNSRGQVETNFIKTIKIIRSLRFHSLSSTEPIYAVGNWRGIMPYEISLSSKMITLGDFTELSLKVSSLYKQPIKCVLKYVKVYMIQILKCPRKTITDVTDEQSDSGYFSLKDQLLLKTMHYNDREEPCDPFELTWSLQIPRVLSFKIHPYSSDIQRNDVNHRGFKVHHSLQVTMGIEPTEFVTKGGLLLTPTSFEKKQTISHGKTELKFKTRVFLLNPLVKAYKPAPVYDETISSCDSKLEVVPESRSSIWQGYRKIKGPPTY